MESNNCYELTRQLVDWDFSYNLSRASLGQIVETFARIRLEPKDKHVYEKTLYSKIKPLIECLLEEFDKMLKVDNIIDYQVVSYNLIGNLPKGTIIYPNEHRGINLGRANIGNLLKALKQRIDFILERDPPKFYLGNPYYLNAFNAIRAKLNVFLESVQSFENEFVEAIKEAHEAQQMKYGKSKSSNKMVESNVNQVKVVQI